MQTIKKEPNRNSEDENTVTELKTSLEQFNSRYSQVQERISELENRLFLSVQSEKQNDKNF